MKGARAGFWALAAAAASLPLLVAFSLRPAVPRLGRPALAGAAGDAVRLAGFVRGEVAAGLRAALRAGRGGSAFPPLARAARAGSVERIDRLLAAGADPDVRDRGPNGWTPLMHAVHKGQEAAVVRLLAGGARVDAASRNGTTALMLAAGQGETAIVDRLLAAGARPGAATPFGATALGNAVAGGHAAVVRALLAADPRLRLGDSLPDRLSRLVARVRGDAEILALLDGRRPSEGRS
jgi:ankyrin repeat protein